MLILIAAEYFDQLSLSVARRYLRVLAITGLALAEVSCDAACFIADQTYLIDTRNGFYLVYRVSGLQQKVEFFEVYQGKPEFDSCGSARTPAMATELYERKKGLLKKVGLHGIRLEITYTAIASEAIEPREARLSQ